MSSRKIADTREKRENILKIIYILLIIESILISYVIAVLLFSIYVPISFYLHEGGHILGGILNDVITGQPIHKYIISNWVNSTIPYLQMPQQTRIVDGNGSALMTLGGMYAVIGIFLFTSYIIYAKCNFKTKNLVLLIPIYVVITEIVSNFICGTDNWQGKPFDICQENILIQSYFNWNFYLLILIFFIIILPLILTETPYLLDRVRKFVGNKAEYL